MITALMLAFLLALPIAGLNLIIFFQNDVKLNPLEVLPLFHIVWWCLLYVIILPITG